GSIFLRNTDSSRSSLSRLRETKRYRVSGTLPCSSSRKHSLIPSALRLRLPSDSTPADLHESWRLASSDGGASTSFGATCAHTAWSIESNRGPATAPPVEPLPSVRCWPSALS